MTKLRTRKLTVLTALLLVGVVGCKLGASSSSVNLAGQTTPVTQTSDVPSATVLVKAYIPGSSNQFYACSGVLVSKDLVLTAAHCLKDPLPERIKIEVAQQGPEGLEQKTTVDVVQWKIHPKFIGKSPNDFAILQLKDTLPSHAAPVTIAPEGSLSSGLQLLLVAYGSSSTDSARLVPLSGRAVLTNFPNEVEFAIGAASKGAIPEHGDSGGPAYVKMKDRWYVAGLMSRRSSYGFTYAANLSSSEISTWILDVAREFKATLPNVTFVSGGSESQTAPAVPSKEVVPAVPAASDACGECNQAALRICLQYAGGNACYPKWKCAVGCEK
jgi:secreted trypsin-like serine protease